LELTKTALTPKGSYRLPIPQPLQESLGVSYNRTSVRELATSPGYATSRANMALQNVLSRTADAAAYTGFTPNEFRSVILDQPEFRMHSFSWILAPQSKEESQQLQKIITSLKRAMLPKTSSAFGRFVLVFPHIFELAFTPNNQMLFKFKPSVISNMAVNYMPGGAPAFYSDGFAPEAIRLDLEFMELEYWLESDVKVGEGGLPTQDAYDSYYSFISAATQARANLQSHSNNPFQTVP
jgi:hypothetical protein